MVVEAQGGIRLKLVGRGKKSQNIALNFEKPSKEVSSELRTVIDDSQKKMP